MNIPKNLRKHTSLYACLAIWNHAQFYKSNQDPLFGSLFMAVYVWALADKIIIESPNNQIWARNSWN